MRQQLKRWLGDQRGAMAIHLAVMAPAMLAATAFAVDYGRVVSKQAQIQSALDTATLAATQALSYDASIKQSKLEEIAKSFFLTNIATLSPNVTCSAPALSVDRPELRITGKTSCTIDSQFGAIMSEKGFDVALASTTDFDFGEADIAFMIDVSGSMSGSKKIGALKTAMKDAVDTLLAVSVNGSVRIALAPYSTAVNAGSYADKATGGLPKDGDDCVTERSGAHAFTDASPTVATLRDDAGWCPKASIVPLTDNAKTLKNEIDDFSASGYTAGHLGTAWAWYLISPKWAGFWPASAKPKAANKSTRKAVVLMTDGEYNTYYQKGQGDSADQAEKLCDAMKDDGVIVYAVAFQAPSKAEKLLTKCSSGAGYYFEPKDEAALKAAYKEIANSFRRHILTN